jgi:hypothetical protein
MNKDLLTRLSKTKSVTLPGGVLRALDDAELASIVGGLKSPQTFSWVYGQPNDIVD